MPAPKEVFEVINNSVNAGLRDAFGPPDENRENLTAAVAVALLQLSLRYFADTGAPKQVVVDFFNELLGGKPQLKEDKEKGRLVIEPTPDLIRRLR